MGRKTLHLRRERVGATGNARLGSGGAGDEVWPFCAAEIQPQSRRPGERKASIRAQTYVDPGSDLFDVTNARGQLHEPVDLLRDRVHLGGDLLGASPSWSWLWLSSACARSIT